MTLYHYFQYFADTLEKLALCNQQTTDCYSCPYFCRAAHGDYCSLDFHLKLMHLLREVPGDEARELFRIIRECEDCYHYGDCLTSCERYDVFGKPDKHAFYKKAYAVLKEAGAYDAPGDDVSK